MNDVRGCHLCGCPKGNDVKPGDSFGQQSSVRTPLREVCPEIVNALSSWSTIAAEVLGDTVPRK